MSECEAAELWLRIPITILAWAVTVAFIMYIAWALADVLYGRNR